MAELKKLINSAKDIPIRMFVAHGERIDGTKTYYVTVRKKIFSQERYTLDSLLEVMRQGIEYAKGLSDTKKIESLFE